MGSETVLLNGDGHPQGEQGAGNCCEFIRGMIENGPVACPSLILPAA